MNPKLILFFALIAVAFAAENSERHARSLVYTTGLRLAPTYYEGTIPTYNYYRTRSLDRYPPGVDPIKCPNYPYCGTDAGSLVVPPVVPHYVVPAPIAPTPIPTPILPIGARYYVVSK